MSYLGQHADQLVHLLRTENSFNALRAEVGKGRFLELRGFHPAALRELVVTRIQSEFPDCEAFREVAPGRWHRVRIEFEFESRNFLLHNHNPKKCDLIVCWKHNWAECPVNIEVIELSHIMKRLGVKGILRC